MGVREHDTVHSPGSDDGRRPAGGLRSFHLAVPGTGQKAAGLGAVAGRPGHARRPQALRSRRQCAGGRHPSPGADHERRLPGGQDRVSHLTYMIDCGPEGVAIIDPTYVSEFERTLGNVEKCGRNRKEIRWVVNTHCHVDHAMADKQFRDLGAKIAVHEADAAAIEKGSRVTAYYLIKEDTGKVAPFPHCPIDMRLADGEELRLGNKTLEVIHTPGHTPGSACFLLKSDGKNVLFSGDTVLYDGRLG